MENFDFPTGAAGFAVNVDDLVEIKLKDSNKDEAPIPEILVCAKDGFEITAIEKQKNLSIRAKMQCLVYLKQLKRLSSMQIKQE